MPYSLNFILQSGPPNQKDIKLAYGETRTNLCAMMNVLLHEKLKDKWFNTKVALRHYYVVDGVEETAVKSDGKEKNEGDSDDHDTTRCFSLFASTQGYFGLSWMSYFGKNLHVTVHSCTNLETHVNGNKWSPFSVGIRV